MTIQEPETPITATQPTAKKGRRPVAERLVEAHDKIVTEPPDRSDFLHTVMCQVGMPRRATEATVFERNNGPFSISLEAGKLWNGKEWVPQPFALRYNAPSGDGTSQFRSDPY